MIRRQIKHVLPVRNIAIPPAHLVLFPTPKVLLDRIGGTHNGPTGCIVRQQQFAFFVDSFWHVATLRRRDGHPRSKAHTTNYFLLPCRKSEERPWTVEATAHACRRCKSQQAFLQARGPGRPPPSATRPSLHKVYHRRANIDPRPRSKSYVHCPSRAQVVCRRVISKIGARLIQFQMPRSKIIRTKRRSKLRVRTNMLRGSFPRRFSLFFEDRTSNRINLVDKPTVVNSQLNVAV